MIAVDAVRVLLDLARDARHRRRGCPICGAQPGAYIGDHVTFDHTPAEVDAYCRTRKPV